MVVQQPSLAHVRNVTDASASRVPAVLVTPRRASLPVKLSKHVVSRPASPSPVTIRSSCDGVLRGSPINSAPTQFMPDWLDSVDQQTRSCSSRSCPCSPSPSLCRSHLSPDVWSSRTSSTLAPHSSQSTYAKIKEEISSECQSMFAKIKEDISSEFHSVCAAMKEELLFAKIKEDISSEFHSVCAAMKEEMHSLSHRIDEIARYFVSMEQILGTGILGPLLERSRKELEDSLKVVNEISDFGDNSEMSHSLGSNRGNSNAKATCYKLVSRSEGSQVILSGSSTAEPKVGANNGQFFNQEETIGQVCEETARSSELRGGSLNRVEGVDEAEPAASKAMQTLEILRENVPELRKRISQQNQLIEKEKQSLKTSELNAGDMHRSFTEDCITKIASPQRHTSSRRSKSSPGVGAKQIDSASPLPDVLVQVPAVLYKEPFTFSESGFLDDMHLRASASRTAASPFERERCSVEELPLPRRSSPSTCSPKEGDTSTDDVIMDLSNMLDGLTVQTSVLGNSLEESLVGLSIDESFDGAPPSQRPQPSPSTIFFPW